MRHYRKTIKAYAKHNAGDEQLSICTLCNEYVNKKSTIVAENETMFIINNRVPYDMFEGQRVASHLIVLPKRHVETIAGFTDKEMIGQMKLIGEYENKGYDAYARSVGSVARTVKHQHTHLIKLANVNRWPKLFIFIRKPYFLIER